ncbi:MAG: hypothetical protein KDD48_07635 [Bdellovibrionales bacterium]|nr:hypothetical protein [Bdellovibrionales bacterium]
MKNRFYGMVLFLLLLFLGACSWFGTPTIQLSDNELQEVQEAFKQALETRVRQEGGEPKAIVIEDIGMLPNKKNRVQIVYELSYFMPTTSEAPGGDISFAATSILMPGKIVDGKATKWHVELSTENNYQINFLEMEIN